MLFQANEWRILRTLLEEQLAKDLPRAIAEAREPSIGRGLTRQTPYSGYNTELGSNFYIVAVEGLFRFSEEEYIDLLPGRHEYEALCCNTETKRVRFWKYGMTMHADARQRDPKNYKEILFSRQLGQAQSELAEQAFYSLMCIRHSTSFAPHNRILPHPLSEGRAFLRGVAEGFAGRTEAFDFSDRSDLLVQTAEDMVGRLDDPYLCHQSYFLLNSLPGIIETIAFVHLNLQLPCYRARRNFGDLKRLLEMSANEEDIYDYAVKRVLGHTFRSEFKWFHSSMRQLLREYAFEDICSMKRIESLISRGSSQIKSHELLHSAYLLDAEKKRAQKEISLEEDRNEKIQWPRAPRPGFFEVLRPLDLKARIKYRSVTNKITHRTVAIHRYGTFVDKDGCDSPLYIGQCSLRNEEKIFLGTQTVSFTPEGRSDEYKEPADILAFLDETYRETAQGRLDEFVGSNRDLIEIIHFIFGARRAGSRNKRLDRVVLEVLAQASCCSVEEVLGASVTPKILRILNDQPLGPRKIAAIARAADLRIIKILNSTLSSLEPSDLTSEQAARLEKMLKARRGSN